MPGIVVDPGHTEVNKEARFLLHRADILLGRQTEHIHMVTTFAEPAEGTRGLGKRPTGGPTFSQVQGAGLSEEAPFKTCRLRRRRGGCVGAEGTAHVTHVP